VYRVATGYQTATSDVVRQAFVIAGFNNVTTPQSPIPISFTETQALVSPASAVPFAGIGLGMSFCYFGKDIPEGYTELNGTGRWPTASWVPESLQGMLLPNAKGALVGVAKDPGTIGTIAPAGALPFTLQQALWASYVPANPPLMGRNDFLELTPNPGAWIGQGTDLDNRTGKPDPKYFGNVNWTGWVAPYPVYQVGSYNAFSRDHLFSPYVAQLVNGYIIQNPTGVASLSNPPNLQCRWIMRK
jgi:hypothetical protein